jgi:hypothetical protein
MMINLKPYNYLYFIKNKTGENLLVGDLLTL